MKKIPWGERTTEIDFEIQKLESLIQQYEALREEEQRQLKEKELTKLRGTEFEAGYDVVKASDNILNELERKYKGIKKDSE